MKIEHYPEEKLKKEVRDVVGKYLDLNKYKVFFFGSRVRGDNFEVSDIDIGIDGGDISPEIKMDIVEDIDSLPTLYTFDIVDFNKVSEDFKKEALKNIEYV
ncbi:MAG: nucleotidyltransferase domain-containing protein [Candidatus Pacebacteria bacterium]|nr:nucleotidyltransferase domain-containing protein [Candidatus Paceibacterota bacterium]